jgi:hypothetical protein
MEYGCFEAGLPVYSDGAHPGDAPGRCGHHGVRPYPSEGVPQEQFGVAAQAGRNARDDKVFQITPGIEKGGSLPEYKGLSGAGFYAGRISFAEITFHDLIGQDVVRDTRIGAGEGAELAVDALFLAPQDDPCFHIFGKSRRRAVHHALGLPALAAKRDSVMLLHFILGDMDS